MRVAVVGAGIIGLGISYELLNAGHEVSCYESNHPMGGRSRGIGRIFRLVHRKPSLIELADEAWHRWNEWSNAAGIQLVGDEGVVVSGEIDDLVSAMNNAGASFEVRDSFTVLPADNPKGPFLVDIKGGVINTTAAGSFLIKAVGVSLLPLRAVDVSLAGAGVQIKTNIGTEEYYDLAVIAAGEKTPDLVAPLGIELPSKMIHNFRFTFPLRDTRSRPPCWIDRSSEWRPGFWAYGQISSFGEWAVGGHLPEGEFDVSMNYKFVEQHVKDTLTLYVSEHLTGCRPAVIDTLYGTGAADFSDGFGVSFSGNVIATWGENLFKVAPAAASAVANAIASDNFEQGFQKLNPYRP